MDEKKSRILLVEDEAILAMTTKAALEKYGYSVAIIDTGERAVELFKSEPEIDLVLMDIDLGKGIDGPEAAAQILSGKNVPVVFLSSHTEPAIVEKTERITSYGYVVKNSSITVLDASIKTAMKLFNANKHIKKINAKLESTIDALPDILVEIGLDGIYHFIHSSNPGLLYESMTDRVGKNIGEILPRDTADRIMAAVREAHETGISSGRQYSLEVPAGLRHFELSVSPLSGTYEQPHFIILCRDITGRKDTEAAINSIEEKFAKIYKASPDAITIASLPTGKFLEVNDAFLEITGFSKEEVIGHTSTELNVWTNPDDRTAFIEALEEKGSLRNLEIRFRVHDGDIRWFSVSSEIIDLAGSPHSLNFIHDIDEQKRTELRLRTSEAKIQLLLNSTAEAIYGIDILGDCTFCNDACLRMLGYEKPDDLLGRNMHWRIHGKHADGTPFPVEDCRIFKALSTGVGTHVVDEVLWRADGTSFHAEYWSFPQKRDGLTVGAVVTFLDITERKRTEEALMKSEQTLKIMADSGQALVWMSGTDKLCNYFNKIWLDFTGRTFEEESGIGWTEGVHPDDFRYCLDTYTAAFDRRENFGMEYRMRRHDGEYRWILDEGSPCYGRDREFIGYIGHCLDITEQKTAEEKIKILLSEKELILKEVHHRIKNNMNTVYSLLMLQSSVVKDSTAMTALTDAAARVRSMQVLYDKLYKAEDFTELTLPDYLSPLIDEILANFPESSRIKIEKNIGDFGLKIPKLQPLGIIVNELLTNIMKYAFTGRQEGTIRVSASRDKGIVTFILADDGNGMPDSVSFENSTGFGLVLVNGLTRQLDGAIRIERGHGTAIVLEFKE